MADPSKRRGFGRGRHFVGSGICPAGGNPGRHLLLFTGKDDDFASEARSSQAARRILSGGSADPCPPGKRHLFPADSITTAHYLLFFVALVHIVYSLFTFTLTLQRGQRNADSHHYHRHPTVPDSWFSVWARWERRFRLAEMDGAESVRETHLAAAATAAATTEVAVVQHGGEGDGAQRHSGRRRLLRCCCRGGGSGAGGGRLAPLTTCLRGLMGGVDPGRYKVLRGLFQLRARAYGVRAFSSHNLHYSMVCENAMQIDIENVVAHGWLQALIVAIFTLYTTEAYQIVWIGGISIIMQVVVMFKLQWVLATIQHIMTAEAGRSGTTTYRVNTLSEAYQHIRPVAAAAEAPAATGPHGGSDSEGTSRRSMRRGGSASGSEQQLGGKETQEQGRGGGGGGGGGGGDTVHRRGNRSPETVMLSRGGGSGGRGSSRAVRNLSSRFAAAAAEGQDGDGGGGSRAADTYCVSGADRRAGGGLPYAGSGPYAAPQPLRQLNRGAGPLAEAWEGTTETMAAAAALAPRRPPPTSSWCMAMEGAADAKARRRWWHRPTAGMHYLPAAAAPVQMLLSVGPQPLPSRARLEASVGSAYCGGSSMEVEDWQPYILGPGPVAEAQDWGAGGGGSGRGPRVAGTRSRSNSLGRASTVSGTAGTTGGCGGKSANSGGAGAAGTATNSKAASGVGAAAGGGASGKAAGGGGGPSRINIMARGGPHRGVEMVGRSLSTGSGVRSGDMAHPPHTSVHVEAAAGATTAVLEGNGLASGCTTGCNNPLYDLASPDAAVAGLLASRQNGCDGDDKKTVFGAANAYAAAALLSAPARALPAAEAEAAAAAGNGFSFGTLTGAGSGRIGWLGGNPSAGEGGGDEGGRSRRPSAMQMPGHGAEPLDSAPSYQFANPLFKEAESVSMSSAAAAAVATVADRTMAPRQVSEKRQVAPQPQPQQQRTAPAIGWRSPQPPRKPSASASGAKPAAPASVGSGKHTSAKRLVHHHLHQGTRARSVTSGPPTHLGSEWGDEPPVLWRRSYDIGDARTGSSVLLPAAAAERRRLIKANPLYLDQPHLPILDVPPPPCNTGLLSPVLMPNMASPRAAVAVASSTVSAAAELLNGGPMEWISAGVSSHAAKAVPALSVKAVGGGGGGGRGAPVAEGADAAALAVQAHMDAALAGPPLHQLELGAQASETTVAAVPPAWHGAAAAAAASPLLPSTTTAAVSARRPSATTTDAGCQVTTAANALMADGETAVTHRPAQDAACQTLPPPMPSPSPPPPPPALEVTGASPADNPACSSRTAVPLFEPYNADEEEVDERVSGAGSGGGTRPDMDVVERKLQGLFWWGRPQLLLWITHVNYLQNSLSLTLCLYYMLSYGTDSSILQESRRLLHVWLPLLVANLALMLYIGWVVVPLYTLVTTTCTRNPRALQEHIRRHKKAEEEEGGITGFIIEQCTRCFRSSHHAAARHHARHGTLQGAHLNSLFLANLANQAGVVMAGGAQRKATSSTRQCPFISLPGLPPPRLGSTGAVYQEILLIWLAMARVRRGVAQPPPGGRFKLQADVSEFRATFQALDGDCSGTVTSHELSIYLLLLTGTRLSRAELKAMVAEIDRDGDGKVSFSEFLVFMMFCFLDGDGNGCVEMHDIVRASGRVKVRLPAADVAAMMELAGNLACAEYLSPRKQSWADAAMRGRLRVACALGIQAFQQSDQGGCGLWNTLGCFAGWPNATGHRHSSISLYHNVELGWYLHYLLKHSLGIGMQDNLQMHLHHASTISLLLISFTLNLYRSGVLVLCLLNLSNPFLHVAKALHYLEASADTVTFLLFAVVFFFSRVVAYPAVVLRATLLESWQVHPPFLDPNQHLPVYLAANALLLLLMVMQLQWFAGIVRLLTKALTSSKEEFKEEGKAHDYAKTKHE
ncbi:hypothetical protein VOLCADRAFT_103628 [Volvox carteri f. nagariensis]|uniref:TLC domain-containing protein n=1 Tax=Volvox carteri f. nagariensis TaxID=3068 RepID=D8TNH6_VOLCA|nr:uncharacterized protein VOLCADRAFT_103628 [Volvox carteri f. nagariensis]EFJ50996.1 hypothetical protein VOLCADRAFT_103628 [Volvox carteri f. nagariensis]|eukprot:XP_002948008.1 hypothetical protein VOLCADRAFT_103628 [Volvox carteri f. nagariensis]